MKDPLLNKPHTEGFWFILFTHTLRQKHQETAQEAFRGHTAFPGFQRSSGEPKHKSDQPKKPKQLPSVGRTLQIHRVKQMLSDMFGLSEIASAEK